MLDVVSPGTIKGAALVEDHAFPSVAAYKSYIAELRRQRIDFYVLSFGPGTKARIALSMLTVPMIETGAKLNVDPVPAAYVEGGDAE